MELKVFQAKVRVASSNGYQVVETRVMAQSTFKARLLFEAQYGRGCLVSDVRVVN